MIVNQNSLLSTLVSQSSTVREQLAQTEEQVASGYVSSSYSGLGNQALTALSLAPQIAHTSAWTANIASAQGTLTVTQDALTSIQNVASSINAQLDGVDTNDPASLTNLVVSAKSALTEVAGYINSKSGNTYVFSGTDSGNAPLTTTDPTTLASQVLASPTPASPPFSSTIGTSLQQVETGDNQWTPVGLIANKNTYAVSQSPTSGSCLNDVLQALSSVTTLTSSNASAVLSNARAQLSSAMTAISTEAGGVAAVQNTLTQRQSDLSTLSTTLQTQLGSAQDVDVAAAITKSSTLQTELQASYEIISRTESLSLSSYLQ